jgi:hypothetical protein
MTRLASLWLRIETIIGKLVIGSVIAILLLILSDAVLGFTLSFLQNGG